MYFFTILPTLLSLAFTNIPTTTAEGINCHGSALCDIGIVGGTLPGLIKIVNDLPEDKTYGQGEHIACQGHQCAFSQKTDETINKAVAVGKLNDLS